MLNVLPTMNPPPFLLLAALLFWGWQSGFFVVGAIMGVMLESARFLRVRWDLSAEDFRRIWNFCTLLALGLVVYVFTTNEASGGLGGLLHSSAVETTRNASVSATAFFRWLPMTLFLFIAAQRFSESGAIPLSAISLFIRWRRKGDPTPERHVNVAYPYFIVCLFAAGIHPNEGTHSYFWGQAVLIAWALWPLRSRRYGTVAWFGALAVALGLGFSGQRGISELQRLIGSYNAQWMASFFRQRMDPSRSVTAIGQIGKIKLSPRIVIRLNPLNGGSPPIYLREASYRTYRAQTWHAGMTGNEFDALLPERDNTIWELLPGRTNSSAVNIACYLDGWSEGLKAPEGLLPLPTGSSRLEQVPLSVASISKNKTGAVMAAGPGLMIFNARYGPGATFDSPPDAGTNHLDLAVPTNEAPALDQIISQMQISGAAEDRKRLAVQQFFAAHFSYSTWLGPDQVARTNETALARFLLHHRSGHCEYFATATVLLLRELGIPARYAVGYAVHEPSGHGYVVRERDAHAWCLVWNEARQMWEDFDTTPASWVAEDGRHAAAMQWISDFWSQVRFQIAKFRWGQTNLRQYILWALIPVLAVLLYQIIFRHRRKPRSPSQTGKFADAVSWPGLDSEFYLLERRLAARGVPRQPSELLSGWLTRALPDPARTDLRSPLEELLRLHYRLRFDPRGLSGPERETLTREAKRCLEKLAL
jgi:hypothetical protein